MSTYLFFIVYIIVVENQSTLIDKKCEIETTNENLLIQDQGIRIYISINI